MFYVSCPELVQEVLVTDAQVEDVTPTTAGDAVEFHCPCGATGVCVTVPDSLFGRLVHHQRQPMAA